MDSRRPCWNIQGQPARDGGGNCRAQTCVRSCFPCFLCDEICLVERGTLLAHDTAAAVFDSHAIDRVFGVTSEAVTDSAGQRHYLFREA